jgi:stress response protein YsnF
MTTEPALPPVVGLIAEDCDGTALGTVTAVYLDDLTGQPTWVGLTDGLHAAPDARDVTIVAPLAAAELTEGRLRLPVPADAVRSAPRPASAERLAPAEVQTLRQHYAVSPDTGHRVAAGPVPGAEGDTPTDAGTGTRAGDRPMTRSEERLRVESVREPWTRAVLRVDTVTEEVLVPVTVTRQRARIEYLPLQAAEGAATPDLSGDDRETRSTDWVTLYGDQPVVTVQRAPVERVRLTTSWVTEEQSVTQRLRREEIALDSDLPR